MTGNKREEELLAKIEALNKDLNLRNTATMEHIGTIGDQNKKITELQAVIKELKAIIDQLKKDLVLAKESGDSATN